MINLITADSKVVDLSISPLFVEHYNKGNSFAKYIIDNEINNGVWFDEILKNLPPDAIIIDAGMNVGLFTIYMNQPGRKFYCIEPDAHHIEVANELFEKLNISAEIFEGVVAKENGIMKIYSDPSNTTMTRIADHGTEVKALTLGSLLTYFKLDKVDFLKLDIEGGEFPVLLEDETVGEALAKCEVVFIETHPGFDGKYPVEFPILNKMEELGFTHTAGTRANSHYFLKNVPGNQA